MKNSEAMNAIYSERREFMSSLLGATAVTALLSNRASASTANKIKVAAVVTEYRHYSHADVILDRLLNGSAPNNERRAPRVEFVSLYTDQVPGNDLSRERAKQFGFKIHPTVAQVLTLNGDKLAVDAVLLIGEHGAYPLNKKGQKLYPRYELFQQIVEVFRRSGRAVPVFNDKHLSYDWTKAKQMYDQSRALKFPLMAGSSIPLTVRAPQLALPLNAPIEHAVSLGYLPGDKSDWRQRLESYGFHALEVLQCLVERRAGGERGIASIELLRGEAVWRWRESVAGSWSKSLVEAATSNTPNFTTGPLDRVFGDGAVVALEYRDGLKAAVYMFDKSPGDFAAAVKLKGRPEPLAANFRQETKERDLPHFDGLVDCIEQFFTTGKTLYPVERTLLTTGALAFAMDSLHQQKRLATPQLSVTYRAVQREYQQTKG